MIRYEHMRRGQRQLKREGHEGFNLLQKLEIAPAAPNVKSSYLQARPAKTGEERRGEHTFWFYFLPSFFEVKPPHHLFLS